MDPYLLETASIILITAAIVLLIFNKLKLPSMIGLFLTGIIIGEFVTSTSIISTISDLGVIFLLFTIGLEFSIEKFSAIRRYAVLGGILQVALTTIITTALMVLFKFDLNQAIFMGFLVCFSSTAIVMKLIKKEQLNHTMIGRVTLGILIFQDIAVILVILITPLLAGQAIDFSTLPTSIIRVGVLALVIIIGGIYVVPRVLHSAAETKNRDLFMLLILFICLGTTYATESVGISAELGAFIAGLIISNTDYDHQTLGYVQPFQDVFMSIFLISIGLLVNVQYFFDNIALIILIAIVVLVVKFVATFLTGTMLKIPLKDTVAISLLLTQIGEFSFILASDGVSYGILDGGLYTTFLTVSIITMTATPFLENLAPTIVNTLTKIPYFQVDEELKTVEPETITEDELEDHVIIVGFGVNGRNLAKACKHYDIPYIIIELNPIIVEKEKNEGEPIIYGDSSNESVLKEAGINTAKTIISATSDHESTIQTVDTARRLNPDIYIIVRTRYVKDVDDLYETGADEVIPEEFETGIVLFSLIMAVYDKNMDQISDMVHDLRAEKYKTFRNTTPDEITTSLDEVTELHAESLYVKDDDKQLNNYDFNSYDLTVTSIIRDNETITDFAPDFKLSVDDLILFTGREDNISRFIDRYKVV